MELRLLVIKKKFTRILKISIWIFVKTHKKILGNLEIRIDHFSRQFGFGDKNLIPFIVWKTLNPIVHANVCVVPFLCPE